MMTDQRTTCQQCTVPTHDGADMCGFCKTYEPPVQAPVTVDHLDAAVQRIDSLRADLNKVIRDLPDETPMFAIVDIVNALWNLRNAGVVLDKAIDALEDTQAVAR